MTKAELDDFKLGRGIPNCVLEARPLCEDFPQLLHEITLSGVKSPYNELTLRLSDTSMPSRRGKFDHIHAKQTIASLISEMESCMSQVYMLSSSFFHNYYFN